MHPLRTLAVAAAVGALATSTAEALPIGVPHANHRVGHPANKVVHGCG